MDTLTNIAVSVPDTIAIAATPSEVMFHSCNDSMPLGSVIAICVTVVICLLIIANATWKCYQKKQDVKKDEIAKKIEAEEKKRQSEQDYKIKKDQYDSAWRTFEYMLKDKLPKDLQDTAKKARKYFDNFWEEESSDSTRKH